MARVYVHAAAALGPQRDTQFAERTPLGADPAPVEFKELVKTVVGVPLRQASHLVELAAIGSQLCLKRLPYPAPENSAVYVGTGLAEVRKTNTLFYQVMPPGPGMASPFDFINAANNMVAFYAAKLGNFRARNLTVTQEEFSFEWALKLALADLHAGSFRQALVGGVDENSQPRASHLRRIRLRDDQWMGARRGARRAARGAGTAGGRPAGGARGSGAELAPGPRTGAAAAGLRPDRTGDRPARRGAAGRHDRELPGVVRLLSHGGGLRAGRTARSPATGAGPADPRQPRRRRPRHADRVTHFCRLTALPDPATASDIVTP
jgi:Beta-ketoacyl synthase, N-terminal domain